MNTGVDVPAGNDSLGGNQTTHPITTSDPPDGGNRWEQYFGPPSHELVTHAYDKYAYETYDLPEAYKGKNLFLRDTIDGFIMEDNEWYTRTILPYAQTDQIHVAWNEWHFNQTLAGRVPHEGISRLITSSKRRFKDHTVRRGLAFILEHGFMTTAEGREQYRRNLFGIKQCVQETCNHDVVSALLGCRNYDKEWERRHGLYNRPFKDVMRRELNEWAIIQKDISGLEILHEEYKKRLSRYGVTADTWIFPPKMSIYATMVPPTEVTHKELGVSTTASFNAGPGSLGKFRGCNVYETRLFDVFENDLPVDLLQRNQQIGSYYVMDDPGRFGRGDSDDKPTTTQRDIYIYNEETDNWARISFAKAAMMAVNNKKLPRDAALRRRRSRPRRPRGPRGKSAPAPPPGRRRGKAAPPSPPGSPPPLVPSSRAAKPKSALRKAAKAVAKVVAGATVTPSRKRRLQLSSIMDAIVLKGEQEATTNIAAFNHHGKSGMFSTMFKDKQHIASSYGEAGLEAGTKFDTVAEFYKTVPTFIKQHMFDYVEETDVSTSPPTTTISSVKAASKTSGGFITKDGRVGVYESSIGPDGTHRGSASEGDTSAIFSTKLKTKADWRGVNINELVSSVRTDSDIAAMESETTPQGIYQSRSLLGACHHIVEEAEKMANSSNSGIYRNIRARTDWTSKKVTNNRKRKTQESLRRDGGDFVDDMLDKISDRQYPQEVQQISHSSAEYNYAKHLIEESARLGINDECNFRFTHLGPDFNNLRLIGAKKEHKEPNWPRVLRVEGTTSTWNQVITASMTYAVFGDEYYKGFDIILLRPFQTYRMSSAIFLKSGYETGATFVGHSDFQLGDDVVSKLHYGNFTFYSKAIVKNPKNIIITPNVFCQGYLGGTGIKFFGAEGYNDAGAPVEYRPDTGRHKADLISVIIPAGGADSMKNPIRMVPYNEADEQYGGGTQLYDLPEEAMKDLSTMYNLAEYSQDLNSDSFMPFQELQRHCNVVCYRGHQFSFDEYSKSHSRVTVNTGHWGPNVYPGVGRVRAGEMKYMEKCNWKACSIRGQRF